MSKLLSLDLSTTCTGWSVFDLKTKKLLKWGAIKPDFKSKKGSLKYPVLQVLKLSRLADQILELIEKEVEISIIIVEEINRGNSRLGQKVLDGFHFILLNKMNRIDLDKVVYFDSDGRDGWRSHSGLNLQLSDLDKQLNKDRKSFNKKLANREKKLDIITKKTLAWLFVNKQYGLTLNGDKTPSDSDVADSIGLGHFYLYKVLK